jgi:hypothetical protein
MPKRFWDYRDVGFNTLAGLIFLIAVWKGIRPKIISKPVKQISIKILAGVLALNLIFLGLCLSNTPSTINRYTSYFDKLAWLRYEEPMTEFGYRHKDPEIGTFLSRLTIEELRSIDRTGGIFYGKMLPQNLSSETEYKALLNTYNPNTNPFLYEFLIHLANRNGNFKTYTNTGDIYAGNVSFRENVLLERYFENTLKHSSHRWSEEKTKNLQKSVSLWKGHYVSKTGKIITSFRLQTILIVISFLLMAIWISAEFWMRKLET